MNKKLFLIILIGIFFIPIQLFANDNSEIIYLNVIVRDDIKSCRYQFNSFDDNNWNLLDINSHTIRLKTNDKTKDCIYYQYSFDNANWSETVKLKYNEKTEKWETVEEIELAFIDTKDIVKKSKTEKQNDSSIYLGGVFVIPTINISDNIYSSGYGASFRFENPKNEVDLYNEVSYWYGESENSAISSIHTALLGVGVDYPLNLGIFSLIPEVGGGVLIEVPVHATNGAMYFFDMYGDVGLNIVSKINKDTKIFMRGNAIAFKGDNSFSVESIITAGTSISL